MSDTEDEDKTETKAKTVEEGQWSKPWSNDKLQSSDANPAYGQNAHSFGAGGQTVERAFDTGHDDKPDRDVERDQSLPVNEHPSRSKR
jgi:hypothetical protein